MLRSTQPLIDFVALEMGLAPRSGAQKPAAFGIKEGIYKTHMSLKLPGWDSGDLNVMAEAARCFLEGYSRWLLVFDNAQEPQDIRPYLPRGGRGDVIITSRNPIWGNLARAIEVSRFDRPESIEFMLKRTGQEDEKAADELAEALGDLPLALEQAWAYMEATAKPLARYLKVYQDRKLEVLAKGIPSDYPDTVAIPLRE